MLSVCIVHNSFSCNSEIKADFLVSIDISNNIIIIFSEGIMHFHSRCYVRSNTRMRPNHCQQISTVVLQCRYTHLSQAQSEFYHMRRLQFEKMNCEKKVCSVAKSMQPLPLRSFSTGFQFSFYQVHKCRNKCMPFGILSKLKKNCCSSANTLRKLLSIY